MTSLSMSYVAVKSAPLMAFAAVSSLRYLDEASLKSGVLPGPLERATRSTTTILVWDYHK